MIISIDLSDLETLTKSYHFADSLYPIILVSFSFILWETRMAGAVINKYRRQDLPSTSKWHSLYHSEHIFDNCEQVIGDIQTRWPGLKISSVDNRFAKTIRNFIKMITYLSEYEYVRLNVSLTFWGKSSVSLRRTMSGTPSCRLWLKNFVGIFFSFMELWIKVMPCDLYWLLLDPCQFWARVNNLCSKFT